MQSAPAPIAEAVSKELAGEVILWAASPDRWAYARAYWKYALIGVPLLVFSIAWTYRVSALGKSGSLYGILFLPWGWMLTLLSLSKLLSPLWAAWTAGSAYYVVSERRAIIFERKLKLKIESFSPSAVAGYQCIPNGRMGVSIIFQRSFLGHGKSLRAKEIGFIGLKAYAGAEQALDKLIAGNLVQNLS